MKIISIGCVILSLCGTSVVAMAKADFCTVGHTWPKLAYFCIEGDSKSQQTDNASREAYLRGVTKQRAKNYAAAEADFRDSISASASSGYPADVGLAEVLAAQGKNVEALQLFRSIIELDGFHVMAHTSDPRTLLEFALLLNQSGQWAEAVNVYQTALPVLPDKGAERMRIIFDPAHPQPLELAVAAHIGIGLDANWRCNGLGEFENDRAFAEYDTAQHLAPDSPLTNYYYGQGWQKLSPAERKQFGTAQQAKAALQKAVKFGKGEVKLAAAKALKSFS